MKEMITDILIVLGRLVTILPLLLITTIFMGKRAIGELPIFDYLILITLAAVAGADIADPEIKHTPTFVAIIAIGLLQRIVAKLKISHSKFGKLITFAPTVVIQDGKFIYENLKKNRYSIDNVLQMLREKEVFDVNDVETAIIEANGAISVLKKSDKNPVTLEDMGIKKVSPAIAFPVIMDGKIHSNILEQFNLDEQWLHQQLRYRGVKDSKEVFFASINSKLELHVSLRNETNLTVPPINH